MVTVSPSALSFLANANRNMSTVVVANAPIVIALRQHDNATDTEPHHVECFQDIKILSGTEPIVDVKKMYVPATFDDMWVSWLSEPLGEQYSKISFTILLVDS